MKISWYGLSSVRLRHKNKIVYIDPLGEKYGLKPRRLKADMVLLTAPSRLDYNVSPYEDEDNFLVKTPGEFESNEIYVIGNSTEKDPDNTVYFMKMGVFGVLHLGLLSDPEGIMKAIEKIREVDILFLPIGGNGVLSYEDANQVMNQIEPALTIPVFYQTDGVKNVDDLHGESKFLEEAGVEEPRVEDELKVKKSKLDPDEPEIVLLKVQ